MAGERRPGEAPPQSVAGTAGPRPAPPPLDMSGGGNVEDLPARARIISPSLLLPAEGIVFELKPSLWYAAFVSLPVGAIGAAVSVLSFLIEDLPFAWRRWGVVLGISIIGLRATLALLQWLGRTYVLTDRRALKQHGIINVRVECVGLEEIENTFVAQSAFQRALGIGTIFFRCDGARHRREIHTWDHVRRPKEVHRHIVAQIERWKQVRARPAGEEPAPPD